MEESEARPPFDPQARQVSRAEINLLRPRKGLNDAAKTASATFPRGSLKSQQLGSRGGRQMATGPPIATVGNLIQIRRRCHPGDSTLGRPGLDTEFREVELHPSPAAVLGEGCAAARGRPIAGALESGGPFA